MSSQTKHTHGAARQTGSEHAPHVGTSERKVVVDAESMLRSSAAQRDPARLEWLVHDDFSGVTLEGERVGRDELVEAIHWAIPHGERDFTQWSFHDLLWPLVLTTYTLAEGRGSTRHMSIWDVSTGLARLRFHQGTWDSEGRDTP